MRERGKQVRWVDVRSRKTGMGWRDREVEVGQGGNKTLRKEQRRREKKRNNKKSEQIMWGSQRQKEEERHR